MEKEYAGMPYGVSSWITQMGSEPVEMIESFDKSAAYEMDAAHVFKLANGKYSTVIESGCSCYESSDASVEVHTTKKAALKSFNDWKC